MIQTMKEAQEAANKNAKEAERISDWVDDVVWLVDAAHDVVREAEPHDHPELGKGVWISKAEHDALANALHRVNRV